MATKITLQADKRKVVGRKVKTLRAQDVLPANIFGKKIKSESIQVSASEFKKVLAEAGETQIVEIGLDGKDRPVLISNVQIDPVNGNVLHVDFHEIDLNEKVTATVPVEVVGEAPAEKEGTGIMVQQIMELEVEALPQDLPEKLVADVSNLTAVDAAVFVKDLDVDLARVKITLEPETILVKIEEPQKEEEPLPAPAAEGEAEAGAEAPAEGALQENQEAPKEAEPAKEE